MAQAIMGIPSDRCFLATAKKRLGHLVPARLARPATTGTAGAWETIKWLLAHFAAQRPGVAEVLLLTEPILWTCKDLLTLERHGA